MAKKIDIEINGKTVSVRPDTYLLSAFTCCKRAKYFLNIELPMKSPFP